MPLIYSQIIGRTVTTDKLGHLPKFAFVETRTMVLVVMMENEIEAYVLHHYCQLFLILDDHQQNWVEAVIAIV